MEFREREQRSSPIDAYERRALPAIPKSELRDWEVASSALNSGGRTRSSPAEGGRESRRSWSPCETENAARTYDTARPKTGQVLSASISGIRRTRDHRSPLAHPPLHPRRGLRAPTFCRETWRCLFIGRVHFGVPSTFALAVRLILTK